MAVGYTSSVAVSQKILHQLRPSCDRSLMLNFHCVVESGVSTQSYEMGCSNLSVRHANRQPHPRTTSSFTVKAATRPLLHTQDTMAENIYSELRPERQEIRLMFLESGQPEDEIIASLIVTSPGSATITE